MQVERDSSWNSQDPGRLARTAEVIAQLKGSIRVALSEEGWRNSPAMHSNNKKNIASSIERDEISALSYWKPTWSDFMEESRHPGHRYC
jgi:DNA integrity scanning protein DisA with diadenylate cyclase activity